MPRSKSMSETSRSSAEFPFHWSPGIAKQLIEHVLQRNLRPQAITSEQLQFLDGAPLDELRKILQGIQSRYELGKVGEAGEVMGAYVLVFLNAEGELCIFEYDGMHGVSLTPLSPSGSALYVNDHPVIRKSPGALHALSRLKTEALQEVAGSQITQKQKTYWQRLRDLLGDVQSWFGHSNDPDNPYNAPGVSIQSKQPKEALNDAELQQLCARFVQGNFTQHDVDRLDGQSFLRINRILAQLKEQGMPYAKSLFIFFEDADWGMGKIFVLDHDYGCSGCSQHLMHDHMQTLPEQCIFSSALKQKMNMNPFRDEAS